MKRRILDSSFAPAHRRTSLASLGRFARRLASSNATSSPARALPLGTLWDYTLLDRLQLPLSRFRE